MGLARWPSRNDLQQCYPFWVAGNDRAVCLSASQARTSEVRLRGAVRRGYKRAIVALAHKMLRTLFLMLKRGEYYRDSATNYEQLSVQRNASRWIKALARFGYIPAAT